jgi:hypothetical protein
MSVRGSGKAKLLDCAIGKCCNESETTPNETVRGSGIEFQLNCPPLATYEPRNMSENTKSTNINVLIYSHVALWTIHHAEAVELCLHHLDLGDTVYLLSCDGALTSCPANPFHDTAKCRVCRAQTRWTLGKVLKSRVIDVRLPEQHISNQAPSFRSINELARYSENGIPFGELVVSQLVGELRDSFFPVEEHRERIADLLSSAKHLYQFAADLIAGNSIAKAYIWNGRRCSDGPVSFAARDCGIAYETFISANKTSHYITLPAPKVHDLNANKTLLADIVKDAEEHHTDEYIRKEAAIFFQQQRYGTGDYPGFVDFTTKFADPPEHQSNAAQKPVLAIFPSSYWEYYGMDEYRGGVYENHYEGLERILADRDIVAKWDCHIRWHPNLASCGAYERERINKIIARTEKDCHHYEPESSIDSYVLLEQSAAVITFGSTIGIEASYYKKPSILVGRAVYEDLDACYRLKSHDELKLVLAQIPVPKDCYGAVKFGFYIRNRGAKEFRFLVHRGGSDFDYRGCPLRARRLLSLIGKAWYKLKRLIAMSRFVKLTLQDGSHR